jgi:hypothetical protein
MSHPELHGALGRAWRAAALVLALSMGLAGVATSAHAAEALAVDDVILLSQSGIPDAKIIATLERHRAIFKLTAEDEQALVEAGVSPQVVAFMRETPTRFQSPAAPETAPPEPAPVPSATPTRIARTLAEVLAMAREGLTEDELVAAVHSGGGRFELSAEDILEAKRLGLSDRVILAMHAGPVVARTLPPTPKCLSMLECRGGRVCIGGQCTYRACTSAAHCAVGQTCRGGRCLDAARLGSRLGYSGNAEATYTTEERKGVPGLWIPGMAMWAGSYLIVGLTSPDPVAWVPLVGPFYMAGTDEDLAGLWVTMGIIQVAGAAMLVTGATLTRKVRVMSTALGDPETGPILGVGPAVGGLALSLTRF